ncbi:fungal-specific transcription factor domain-containing protein [Lipomyces kononenkoae]|uniref:Fungal-specific transcription factor domain-containing protein n=1 Tax=Lipomyces kononenkoae TaxID=34357 RepID=A0ACC3ST40_LIPKO
MTPVSEGSQGNRETESSGQRIRSFFGRRSGETCFAGDGGPTDVLGPEAIPSPSDSSLGNQTACGSANALVNPDNGSVCSPWEGIYVASAQSIGSYLNTALQQPIAEQSMQPRGASKSIASPTGPGDAEDDNVMGPVLTGNAGRAYLSRPQEQYFLSLFWESYHCTLPIIDEGEFRRLYSSLWIASHTQRKPSALVDIALALSMQYGCAFFPRAKSTNIKPDGRYDDATIAGRSYYRRCQSLLALELESPSLTTVQCQIYSSIYVCCAAFQNMAHTTMALAVRTAQMLGLHLEPPADMPRAERELRKRIWWVLFTVETKTCMKLGRPFAAHDCQTTVAFALDDLETASTFGGVLGSYGTDVTWPTYAVQYQKLIAASCTIYRSMYNKFAEVLCQRRIKSPYKEPQALEICARYLSSRTELLQTWVAQVPAGMKLSRRGSGSPFSTDRTPVDVETAAPLWLQRQRLSYHTMCMNLYRPFVTFSPAVDAPTPAASRHAAAFVAHAIAHTSITRQVLAESDLLNGWVESFQWQWNAAVTTAGFVLAQPVGPSTPAARLSLDAATEALEMFGAGFAVAESAAGLARNLAAKADTLIHRFRGRVMGGDEPGEAVEPRQDGPGSAEMDTGAHNQGREEVVGLDGSGSGHYSDFMDWALTVDAFNSFDYGDNFNPADLWTSFGQ